MRYLFILLAFSFSLLLQGQHCKSLGEKEAAHIKEHISYLTTDELEGRLPGTEGHTLAQNYIELNFKRLGLTQAFNKNYLQEFFIPNKVVIDSSRTFFKYKKEAIPMGLGFYPVEYSSNGQVSAKTE